MERIKCEQIASGSWLSLQKIHYRDNKGVERVWEAVGRKKSAGAVVMICRLNPSGRIILVRQYRPPADSLVVEVPAGLINPGEDPAEAAVRELREETGYKGRVLAMIPDSYSSPGMSSEVIRQVLMEADEEAQGELITEFDESEDIETLLVHPDQLSAFLEEVSRNGNRVDGKVFSFAQGYLMRKKENA